MKKARTWCVSLATASPLHDKGLLQHSSTLPMLAYSIQSQQMLKSHLSTWSSVAPSFYSFWVAIVQLWLSTYYLPWAWHDLLKPTSFFDRRGYIFNRFLFPNDARFLLLHLILITFLYISLCALLSLLFKSFVRRQVSVPYVMTGRHTDWTHSSSILSIHSSSDSFLVRFVYTYLFVLDMCIPQLSPVFRSQSLLFS